MQTEPVPFNYRSRDPSELEADVTEALFRIGLFDQRFSLTPGQTVFELGPGIHFALNIILAGRGARSIVSDRFLAPWDAGYHPEFYRRLQARLERPNPALAQVIEQGGYAGVIQTLEEPGEKLVSIPDASVDIVLSAAVLEHVLSLQDVAVELFRISRPGARHEHQIDMRDHHNFDKPLEFLLLDDAEWEERFQQEMGQSGNRVRLDEALTTFASAGFWVALLEQTVAAPDYLADFLPRLRNSRSTFQRAAERNLRAISARIHLMRI